MPLTCWTILIIVVSGTVFRESDINKGIVTSEEYIRNTSDLIINNIIADNSQILVRELTGRNKETEPCGLFDRKPNVFELDCESGGV